MWELVIRHSHIFDLEMIIIVYMCVYILYYSRLRMSHLVNVIICSLYHAYININTCKCIVMNVKTVLINEIIYCFFIITPRYQDAIVHLSVLYITQQNVLWLYFMYSLFNLLLDNLKNFLSVLVLRRVYVNQ